MLGILVMTALPPTEGHLGLLRFAAAHAQALGGTVHALMCVLPDEPFGRAEHRDALWESLTPQEQSVVRLEIQFSNDPQGPSGPNDDAFWSHWVQTILRHTGRKATHLYSSEEYGSRLALSLNAEHVPYDLNRCVGSHRATDVRTDPVLNFRSIVHPLRDRLRRRIVLFGQESTGKTTLAKNLAYWSNSIWCPEWARPYLESLPTPDVTSDRMDAIVVGQAAAEAAAWSAAGDTGSPFLFLDTDLLSTIGYDEYWASTKKYPRDDQWRRRRMRLESLFVPADLYLVCDSSVPMTVDPLRYGGAERETSSKFWMDMLTDRGLRGEIVSGVDWNTRFNSAQELVKKSLYERAGFFGYERPR